MKYFSQNDFDRCSPPCSIHDMDIAFMERLDRAREIAGIPFIVTSAFRTVDHELKQGRSGKSSHIYGLAIDLACRGSRQRFIMIRALLEVGFNRIGINSKRGFIHVDSDPNKDKDVIWGYDE